MKKIIVLSALVFSASFLFAQSSKVPAQKQTEVKSYVEKRNTRLVNSENAVTSSPEKKASGTESVKENEKWGTGNENKTWDNSNSSQPAAPKPEEN